MFTDGDAGDYDDGDYTWMLKREIRSLNNKLRNVRDKREIVMRERQLLQERIETLVGSIGNEVESRKALRKEINEMKLVSFFHYAGEIKPYFDAK